VRAERGAADLVRDVRALLAVEEPEEGRGEVVRRDGDRRLLREERARRLPSEHAEPAPDDQAVVVAVAAPHLLLEVRSRALEAQVLGVACVVGERHPHLGGLVVVPCSVHQLERELGRRLRLAGLPAGQKTGHAVPAAVVVPVGVHLDVPVAPADAELGGAHALAALQRRLLRRETRDGERVGLGHDLRRAGGSGAGSPRVHVWRGAVHGNAAASLAVAGHESPRERRRLWHHRGVDAECALDREGVRVKARRGLYLTPSGELDVALAVAVFAHRQRAPGGGVVEDGVPAGPIQDRYRELEATERLRAALDEDGDEVARVGAEARRVYLEAPGAAMEFEGLGLEHPSGGQPRRRLGVL